MMQDVLELMFYSLIISGSTFGGGAQALFYEYAVNQTGWITNTDLSAVLAFGYATPGPAVFSTAVFIGYHIAGIFGAVAGAVAIFAVPFVGACMAAKYLQRLLTKHTAQNIITSIGLAATGLVAATAIHLLNLPLAGIGQLAIAALACFISIKWNVNPIFLLLGGLAAGMIM